MPEIIEKTFMVSSPAHLDLSNIRGRVEIRPGGDGVIQVIASKDEHSGDAKRTEVELSQDAVGTVKAVTRFPEGAWSWLFGSFPCRVDYVVIAPRKSFLKVNAVSSEISVEGFEGEFSFRSISGGIDLRNLTGEVKVNTVSGEVELAELNGEQRLNTVSGKVSGKHIYGPVHVDTVSGKIELEASGLSSVVASTVSAGMLYQTAFGEGPYRFNSVSGNVELIVSPETRCSAELHAISGKLVTKLPTTSSSRQNGSQMAEVQGGGVRIFLNSVSGDLSLALDADQ